MPARSALLDGEWQYWGGDCGPTRYSPLTASMPGNVDKLEIAWRWSADMAGGADRRTIKATPLLDDGVLYVPWLNNGMAAIDAGTGKTVVDASSPQPSGHRRSRRDRWFCARLPTGPMASTSASSTTRATAA